MHRYFIKIPWIVKQVFSSYTWSVEGEDRAVYLTFDDGPQPEITPWVLQQLKEYDALATFFCIGKNVEKYPEVFQQVVEAGHAIGNHTYGHLNGWKVTDEEYLEDIAKASKLIPTSLFRPPYGRIRSRQARQVADAMKIEKVRVVMWDVLSADFDTGFSPEQCLRHVTEHASGGSVIVFHDSQKAFPNLSYALPKALEYLSKKGYVFKKMEN